MAKQTDVFYSMHCTFWTDDWSRVALAGVPVCPGCGSVGFEADRAEYLSSARAWEDGTSPKAPGVRHPGYVALLEWARNRCFRSLAALQAAYEARDLLPLAGLMLEPLLRPAPAARPGVTLLCLACGTRAPFGGYRFCPACGDEGVPASSEDEVSVRVTWHELRCLVMWAERFAAESDARQDARRAAQPAEQDAAETDARVVPDPALAPMLRVVYGIADRLHSQHLAKPPLTLVGEVSEVKAAFGEHNVETHGVPGHPDASG